jgi:FixJ family two-component response regulator
MTLLDPLVIIVDDDPSVRNALSLLLSSVGHQVKTYGSAQAFLDSGLDPRGPACLVLDVRMPGLSGLDLQQELTARNRSLPIIFITGHGDIPMSVRAMKKGAVDFLPKPFDDSELLTAVQTALQKAARTNADHQEQEAIRQRLETLTPREHEMLTYLLTGLLNKQIAFELDIAERTVKAHRKQVLRKMGVASIAELVRLAEKAGIKPAAATP